MAATAGLVPPRLHRVPCVSVDATTVWGILEEAGARPWLFLSAGMHPEARRSIVAFDVEAELVIHGPVATWHDASGSVVASDAALELMRRFSEQVPRILPDSPPGMAYDRAHDGPDDEGSPNIGSPDKGSRDEMPPGFCGGLVGWLGFEAARLWYDLPRDTSHAAEPSAAADGLWRLCAGAYVVDHATGNASVWHLRDEGRAHAVASRIAAASAPLRPLGMSAEAGAEKGPTGPERAGADVPWTPSFDASSFVAATRRVKERVAEGDVFQVNLATRFETRRERNATEAGAPPGADELLRRLAASNPGPYMGIFTGGQTTIVSGSPEQLFVVEDGVIRSRPIAGTRRRGRDEADDMAMEHELRTDAKELAEHTMLVDLVRNDVARVAVPGTTHVPRFMDVERYRHVMHLTSTVQAALRPGTGLVDWLGALFPGGTVTGAPKHRATRRILETEPVRRGPYTGSAGFLSVTGDAAWNILIRSLVMEGDRISVHAGSGIVADSDPHREWKEAGRKARAVLEAATDAHAGPDPGHLGACTGRSSWTRPTGDRTGNGRRVVLVDNEDSFVHNLADYCAALGADVSVVSCHDDVEARIDSLAATHVILSPGPGRPEDAGATPRLAKTLVGRLPILGVCLGHQALAHVHGARVLTGHPAHGKQAQVVHSGPPDPADATGGEPSAAAKDAPGRRAPYLFGDLPRTFSAARYHSLHVDEASLGPDWIVTARLAGPEGEAGMVMAMQHREHPAYGVQFHPESICTPHGLSIVARFLESS